MTTSVTKSDARPADGWPTALAAMGLLLVVVFWAYWPTAVGIVTIWYRSETFTHAFVVPPIVAWIIWRRWQQVARISPRAQPWMLVPMLGMSAAWLLGEMTAVNSVTHFAIVAMLVAVVPLTLGLRVTWALLFPLAYLFFCVPTGEFLIPQFMDWTADFTVAALRLSGVPVVREGLNFVIPSGRWSVVEACSGIRYLIASVTVGTLFAHLNFQTTRRRVVFVLVSIAVPVVANWIRAYMIVMIGHLSGNTLAVGVDHLIYGWVFFGVVVVVMFVVGARWAEPEQAFSVPVKWTSPLNGALKSGRLVFGATAFMGMLVLISPLGAKRLIEATARSGEVSLVPPATLSSWQISAADDMVFKPHFNLPTSEFNTVYRRDGARVGLYVAYYRNQTYDRKLVSSDNVLAPLRDTHWARERTFGTSVVVGATTISLRATDLLKQTESSSPDSLRLTGWQVYWIDGTLTANDYVAKVYSAFKQMMGRGDESAVIIIYTVGETPQGRQDLLSAFLRDNFGAIDALLRSAGSTR